MKIKILPIILTSAALSLCAISFSSFKNDNKAELATAADYYDAVTDSMTGTTLLNKLNDIIDTSNVSVSYDWSRYEAADEDPNNSNNVILVYARNSVSKSAHVSGNTGWNREHTFPQSKLQNTKAEKDNHIIFASDNKVNGARSNIKMGVVSGGTVVNDYFGHPTTCRKTTSLFDPNNVARGIVARSTMYAAAMYGYDPLDNFESIATMLTWHLNYPVTSFDSGRNNIVYNNQHNRNPFVDHPEYACRIWGNTNSTTQSICGSASSDPTVNSVSVSPTTLTLNITSGQQTGNLTANVSVSNSAPTTVTWSVTPANQGVTVSNSGVVTASANATTGTYTVKATSTYDSTKFGSCTVTVTNNSGQQTGGSETLVMSEQGFTASTAVPSSVEGTDCTLTFSKGTNNNSPAYYSPAVRLYGGNTLTISSSKTIVSVVFTFASNDGSNSISATPGSFSGTTWTGSTNSVTFTIGGSSGNRRISSIEITYEGSSSTKTLSSIEIAEEPDKVVYFEGDNFDPTGLVITRHYSDNTSDTYSYEGHESEFSFNPHLDDELSSYDEVIDVTYGGQTAYVSIDVGSVYLDSISVQTAPTKTTYFEGDNFDPTGLVITRNYNNDTSDTYTYAEHENEFSFSPSTSTSLTTSHTQVTITYEGESTTQSITVNAVALSSIEVSTAPTKTTYTAGEYFDPTGLVITRNYNNGSSSTYTYVGHTSEFTFNPSTSTALTTSHTSVTITYGNKSTTQTITVNSSGGGGGSGESGSQKISASNSSSYYQSGDICPTGNTTSASASCDAFEVSWLKNNSTTNIAYSYDEMRVYGGHSFTITPKEGYTISTIVITANSSSYANAVGGESVNNCTITVNNSTVTLNPTNGANAVGFTNSAQSRLNYVVVNYEYQSSGSGDKTLTSITLNTENAQTKYMVGDDFSIDDVIVTAHYDDSSSAVVDTPLTFSGYNMNVSNVYEITVSYTENEVTKSASYYITVYERFITAVVSGYVYVGEKLTKDKITVTDSADRVITDFEFDSINYQFTYADAISGQSYTAKTFTNSITYDDLTCSLTVLVKRAAYDTGSPQDLTVTYTDLPTSYQTTTDERTAASGVKFIAYNCANYSSKMQFKASGGYFQTTEAMTLTQLTINNRETNALTVSASMDGSNFTNISGTNDVYNLTGYYYLKVIKNGSGAAYCSSLTITISNAATAKNVANYIMYEDTNNQCLTKLDVALSYLSTLSETELNTFTTSTDYVISTARARLEAWAASQKKTIHYEVNNVTASAPNNLVNNEINSMSSTTITIIVISISASVLACGYFILKKKKLD